MEAPPRLARMKLQAQHHFCSMTLRSMVRVAYLIIGEMRKEGFTLGTLFIVWRKLDEEILYEKVLRVPKRLRTSSRSWQYDREIWIVGLCQRDAMLLDIMWYSRKDRTWNAMVEEQWVRWHTKIRNHLHLLIKKSMSWNDKKPLSGRDGWVYDLGIQSGSSIRVSRGIKPWERVE